jgi:predicted MFS family arabinose efflux permease
VWPFLAQATCVGLGAVLVFRIAASRPPRSEHRPPVRRDIAEGLRWLWGHPPIRTLTITIVTFNVTYGAAWSVLVLYSIERLRMGDIGFGLLTTVSAIGGVLGSASYGRIERHVSLANVMRVGLIIETLTHALLALTRTPAVAMVVLFVFGAHAAVWGTTSTAIRQRAVSIEFQGRVGSVYMMGVQGGIVVGSAVGGVVARVWGVTGPFWFAFVGSAVILACIWRELAHIAHAEAPARSAVSRGR